MDKYEFNKYLAGHLKEISGNPDLSVLEKMHFIRNKKSWKGFSLADNRYYVRTSCPINGAIFYGVLTVNKINNEIEILFDEYLKLYFSKTFLFPLHLIFQQK